MVAVLLDNFTRAVGSEQRKASAYHKQLPKGFYSIGRNGSYRYAVDMAAAVDQVWSMMEEIKSGGQEHAVAGEQFRT